MSKVEKQLLEVTEVTRNDGESDQDYRERLFVASDKLDEATWKKLDDATQKWVNAASAACEAKEEIPDFDGTLSSKRTQKSGAKENAKEKEKEVVETKVKDKKKVAEAKGKDKAPAKALAKGKSAAEAKKGNGGGAPLGRKISYAPNAKITMNIKDNPHRAGTVLHEQFAKYKKGMTVQQALDAGILAVNLRYLSGLGHISIG